MITNLARATSQGVSATLDPNLANNEARTDAIVSAGANLGIVKTASPASGSGVIPGQVIDYLLAVSNDGPATAQNVVVTDLLSAAGAPLATSVPLQFVSIDLTAAPGFTCATPAVGATGTITCTRAALPPTGATPAVIRFKAIVEATALTGTVNNRASISAGTVDPAIGNNTATTQHPVGAFSAVTKFKAASVASVTAGENLTYTLTVTNNGASDAQNVVLTDALPVGTSFVSFTGTGVFAAAGACNFANGTLTCTPKPVAPAASGVLPMGASGAVQLVVKIAPEIAADSVGPNSFVVASATPGVAGTSNGVSVGIVRRSDLSLVKTAPATIAAGEPFDYTLTVRNAGPSAAVVGALLQDALPLGTTFVAITPATANNSAAPSFAPCTVPAVGANGGITCATNQVMPVGATESFTVRVRVNPNMPGGNLSNCATITVATNTAAGDAGPVDPAASNNQSCATIALRVSADLSVLKTTASAARAGRDVIYTLAFANAGPSDASGVTLTDPVPANTTLQTIAPFSVVLTKPSSPNLNATCSLVSNQLVCAPLGNTNAGFVDGVLPAGYGGTFTLTTRVNASVVVGAVIINQVSIATTGGGDPNTTNNTSAVSLTVEATPPSLTVRQMAQSAVTIASYPTQVSPPPAGAGAVPGTNLTYLLVINNTESFSVPNVQVSDTLPTNVTFVAATPDAGSPFTCLPAASGIVRCNAATLAAGSAHHIEITVAIQPTTKAQLTNSVLATGTVNGTSVESLVSTLNTPVAPLSDLQLTAMHTPEPVAPGATVSYTLTLRNNGPSTAAMVSLINTLPTGQSLTAVPDLSGASGFNCGLAGIGATGAITCTAAALAPNAQAIIKLTALVSGTQPAGTVNNTVTASSMSVDPTPASVTDPVTIVASTDLVAGKIAPATIAAGAQMTYTITAANNGPSAASNVMISDPLPAGAVFVAATATGSSTLTTPAINANGTVKAIWAGATPANTTRTLTITVRVGSQIACDTNLINTATISSDTTESNTANNTATATTRAQTVFDLSLTNSTLATAAPGQTIGYTLTVTNLGPSNAAGVVLTDALPAGLTVVGAPTSTLPSTTFTVTNNNGAQTITATLGAGNGGALGGTAQTAGTLPTTATITIIAKVPLGYPFITLANTATVTGTAACAGQGDLFAANNTATVATKIVSGELDPGVSYPALTEASDQGVGSVLFFPLYSSNIANLARENTRISVTNTSGAERACVRLFAVDGATCSVVDLSFCLTANQTVSIQASDIDPGNRGYFVAVAIDCVTGLPRAFNYLVGDEFVKLNSGHAANLGAAAIQAVRFAPSGTDATAQFAQLNFDGLSYTRLPRQLAVDSIASPADGNTGLLVLNRIGGDLSSTAAGLGELTGSLFNDQEMGYSFIAQAPNCQLRQLLSNTFPRTSPIFANAIPAGRTGWMKLVTTGDFGIIGAYFNFNPNTRSSSNAYNQGRNLHTLTLTPSATLLILVGVPTC